MSNSAELRSGSDSFGQGSGDEKERFRIGCTTRTACLPLVSEAVCASGLRNSAEKSKRVMSGWDHFIRPRFLRTWEPLHVSACTAFGHGDRAREVGHRRVVLGRWAGTRDLWDPCHRGFRITAFDAINDGRLDERLLFTFKSMSRRGSCILSRYISTQYYACTRRC